jgi:putative nucleotidyltransferase with HDIG domain
VSGPDLNTAFITSPGPSGVAFRSAVEARLIGLHFTVPYRAQHKVEGMPGPSSTSRLRIVHVRSDRRPDLPLRATLPAVAVESVPVGRFAPGSATDENAVYVIDVNLRNAGEVRSVREGLGPVRARRTIFVLDRANRVEETQALALGGNALVTRPIDPVAFEVTLRGLVPSLQNEEADETVEELEDVPSAIVAGTSAMAALFDGFRANRPPDAAALTAHSRAVDEEIDSVGLDRWIATVRNHHRGTYQHSLLVSGIASRFGLALGLPAGERQTLTAAALVHDIGKIRISTELLDKIGPLNDAEFAIVKRHPEIGADFLAGAGLDPRIVAAVRHHHEYLDGSGYPDGLSGAAIPGVVRLLTICDIFGALVEQRSYKLPVPSDEAYRRLEAMAADGKLDATLVRAFRTTASEITTSQVTVAIPRAWIARDGIRHT